MNGTVALLGPIIGVAMMFITPASLGLINLVSALVYVFVLPAAGIAIALLFFDLRVRAGEAPAGSETHRLGVDQHPDTPGQTGRTRTPGRVGSIGSAAGSTAAPLRRREERTPRAKR